MIEATYRPNVFTSVEDMDTAVNNHIYYNASELPASNRKILRVIAAHAFSPIGTAHLKFETMAHEAECSRVTVSRAIKRLSDLNIITVKQGTKLNGIQGANYYSILNFSHEMIQRELPREMITRENHTKPTASKVEQTKKQTESFNSFKQSFNPFVSSVSNNVNACAMHNDLKQQLKSIYNPISVEGNEAFDQLCKIAFGRLKQYMRTHNVPYLQMEQIVLKAMQDLLNKSGVRNQFAMYSKMIERQTLQLFEQPIEPQVSRSGSGPQAVQMSRNVSRYVEPVPEWFNTRYEEKEEEKLSEEEIEAAHKKIMEKLGCSV